MPEINTRATNVELTEESKSLIIQKLAPISRFLPNEDEVKIDIVMRRVPVEFGSEMYCLSVKVTTPTDIYMGVATDHHLSRALTHVKETLRRTISKGASVYAYQQRPRQRYVDNYIEGLSYAG